MKRKSSARVVSPGEFVTVLFLAMLVPACAGRVAREGDPQTTTVAEPLGLGNTSEPLELEVLTKSCAANRTEDVFRVVNRGAVAVKLSDISIKYWAYDTSGQTLVPSLRKGGHVIRLDEDARCDHDVSGVLAKATSFSPSCGPDATHQANWEITIFNSDGAMLAPGAAWSGISTTLGLADHSNFSPGTSDWYSPCFVGGYTSDVHIGVYFQGNEVTANGVMTAPACRPPPLDCLAVGTFTIPYTGNTCHFNNVIQYPSCTQVNTPVSWFETIQVSYDIGSGWTINSLPLVQNGSIFTATSQGSFGCAFPPGCLSQTFAIDCATGIADFSSVQEAEYPSGCFPAFKCGGGWNDLTTLSGSAAIFNGSGGGSSAPVPDAGSEGGSDIGTGTTGTEEERECRVDSGSSAIATSSSTPIVVQGVDRVIAIAAGDEHACALLADGTVSCWGDNSSGQLGVGDGVVSFSSTPLAVTGLNDVTAIAAGWYSTCARVRDGSVWCWGDGQSGQLGSGTSAGSSVPVAVSGVTAATAISVSGTHACALLVTGTITCWGDDGSGELGNGATQGLSTPVPVTDVSGAIAVTAADSFTCALLSDGRVVCWGGNGSGQLGNRTTTDSATRVRVLGLSGATALSASSVGSFACASDGRVACWGLGSNGQLGNGTTVGSTVAGPVSGVCNATAVSAGSQHACALLTDGTVSCWGSNLSGQLGSGSTISSSTPESVVGLTGASSIVAGGSFSCALRRDGRVACWGDNSVGQLGIGLPIALADAGSRSAGVEPGPCAAESLRVDLPVPSSDAPVSQHALHEVRSVVAGNLHACALLANGNVECWGDNHAGQLGDGNNLAPLTLEPVLVEGLSDVMAIAAGGDSTCALLAGGVSCWGTTSFAPVLVGGLGAAKAISVGANHACALLSDGRASCWGDDTFGELGDGTTSSSSTPVMVQGVNDATAIAAGDTYTCVLRSGGTVACWGDDTLGRLGDGTNTASLTPVSSPFIRGAKTLRASAVGGFTCAGGGTAVCWGANSSGQLGNGTTDSSSVPVAVSGLCDVTAMAAGLDSTCALRAGGTIACWGDNASGELGDGTTVGSVTPAGVLSEGEAKIRRSRWELRVRRPLERKRELLGRQFGWATGCGIPPVRRQRRRQHHRQW